MPYINDDGRRKFETLAKEIFLADIASKGELEFLIALLQKRYMSTREGTYTNLHDAVYATIHAGDEFRRRYLDKREDHAIEVNGDI